MVEKKIRILIAVHDKKMRIQCVRVLQMLPMVQVLSVALDGEQAFERVMRYWPDIVVAEVLMPKLDGYSLLEKVKLYEGRPKFIFCYSVISELLGNQCEQEDILQCLAFPVPDRVLKKQMKAALAYYEGEQRAVCYRRQLQGEFEGVRETVVGERNLPAIVSMELGLLGTDTGYTGYRYLHRAICILLECPEPKQMSMTRLYQQIAEECQVPYANVERCIRTVIQHIWHEGNINNIKKIWGSEAFYSESKPTNGAFIRRLCQTILREYQW